MLQISQSLCIKQLNLSCDMLPFWYAAGQVENAEVRKLKYENASMEVRRKAHGWPTHC